MLTYLGAALAAGILAAFGPYVLARLPEPEDPDEDKIPYVDLAGKPHLAIWLALGAAVCAGLVAWTLDDKWFAPMWVVLCAAGVLLAYVDWHTQLLPYLIVAPLNLAVLLLAVLGAGFEGDWKLLLHGVISGVAVWVVFRIMHQFSGAGLGYGDVRLGFALGVALGTISVGATVWGVWSGFLLGPLFSIVLSGMKLKRRQAFAFGPYLLLGAIIGATVIPALS